MTGVSLLCIDPALGRLDYHLLSDQTLMEMLIDGIWQKDKEKLFDTNGNFIDACEWMGVKCEGDRVTHIIALHMEFRRKMFPFWYIPPLVEKFVAEYRYFHGTLNTNDLPRGLRNFNVAYNKLNGTLSLRELPRSLEKFRVYINLFSGSVAFADLPQSLKVFDAGGNQFSGEISWNAIPPKLKYLNLWRNALTGSINIERLPASMQSIVLSANAFSGDFTMLSIPKNIEIKIIQNQLSGRAILAKQTGNMHFTLAHDCITSVVDENGEKHEWHNDIMQYFALLFGKLPI